MAAPSQKLIQAALRETLDSVVSPSERQSVLDSALAEVEGGVLPDDVYGFRRFVHGPLRAALARVLGTSLAETIASELELAGCSIPPTARPSAAVRARRPDPLRDPVIPAHPLPRSVAALPHRTASPLPARRSSPPCSRRGHTPWPAPPVPRGASRGVRSSSPQGAAVAGVSSGSPHEIPTRSTEAPAMVDPLAALPPLPAPAEAPGGDPGRAVPDRLPYVAGFLPRGLGDPTSPGLAAQRPLVIVASRDSELIARLTEWLAGGAEIRVVADVLDLVGEALALRRVLVVVDCNRPSVRPVAVAALVDELPSTVEVLLWSPSVDDELAIRTVATATDVWHRCMASTTVQLARQCLELLG